MTLYTVIGQIQNLEFDACIGHAQRGQNLRPPAYTLLLANVLWCRLLKPLCLVLSTICLWAFRLKKANI